MNLRITFDCSGVNWRTVSQTLKRVGMAYYEPEIHRKAFENSHTSVFVYDGDRLVAFGRAISDDAYQAAIYDMAVEPEYQRQGIGTAIMKHILNRVRDCNVILYAAIGKEAFYEKMGLRRMRTGMALFKESVEMQKKGLTD
ncbi:MAG: GNAT family N-acetyltransferase [Deltaproteobacteria bacterium]